VDEQNPEIYAYTRELEGKKMLILLNFSQKNASTVTDKKLGKLLINNYPTVQKVSGNKIVLRPYEARVYEVK